MLRFAVLPPNLVRRLVFPRRSEGTQPCSFQTPDQRTWRDPERNFFQPLEKYFFHVVDKCA